MENKTFEQRFNEEFERLVWLEHCYECGCSADEVKAFIRSLLSKEKPQYIIHLHDGDTIKIGGVPYKVMGDWEVIGSTKPTEENLGIKVDWEKV